MDGESVFINITAGEWLDTATLARKEAAESAWPAPDAMAVGLWCKSPLRHPGPHLPCSEHVDNSRGDVNPPVDRIDLVADSSQGSPILN